MQSIGRRLVWWVPRKACLIGSEPTGTDRTIAAWQRKRERGASRLSGRRFNPGWRERVLSNDLPIWLILNLLARIQTPSPFRQPLPARTWSTHRLSCLLTYGKRSGICCAQRAQKHTSGPVSHAICPGWIETGRLSRGFRSGPFNAPSLLPLYC